MGASSETFEGSCDEVALLHYLHWDIFTYIKLPETINIKFEAMPA